MAYGGGRPFYNCFLPRLVGGENIKNASKSVNGFGRPTPLLNT